MRSGDQLPLFDSPAPPPQRPEREPSTKVRYSKVKTHGKRLLCDDCCLDIHKLGQALAPLPRRALWRRHDKARPMLLCQKHKDERYHSDEG